MISEGKRIDCSTWDGWLEPLAHAEPALHAMP